MSTITSREAAEVAAANESGRQPVVFVHGLWLLASSWDEWRRYFEGQGYATVAVDWPGDPEDVLAAHRDASGLAGTSVPDVADHIAEVVNGLARKPILVGHSFGGLLVQIVAGRGVAAATISIDPAPHKGVLPLPFSALKAAFPVLGNPGNLKKTVTLTFDQFRFGFANAVSENEAKELYSRYHVPAPGRPLFQAAFANMNFSKATAVDTKNAARGPMLLVSGGTDNIVPPVLTNAAFKRQKKNAAATEVVEIADAGHSLVIDSRWHEVADAALAFIRKHVAVAA